MKKILISKKEWLNYFGFLNNPINAVLGSPDIVSDEFKNSFNLVWGILKNSQLKPQTTTIVYPERFVPINMLPMFWKIISETESEVLNVLTADVNALSWMAPVEWDREIEYYDPEEKIFKTYEPTAYGRNMSSDIQRLNIF
jgi:hypothetical protein